MSKNRLPDSSLFVYGALPRIKVLFEDLASVEAPLKWLELIGKRGDLKKMERDLITRDLKLLLHIPH